MKKSWSLLPLLLAALLFAPALAEANSGDFSGGVAIGTGYAGTDAAPTNGLIVQGATGIGTSTPSHDLDVFDGSANGIAFSGASTGNAPSIAVEGSDTDASLTLTAKGTGAVYTSGNTAAALPPAGYVGEYYSTDCGGMNPTTATISISSPAIITVTNNMVGTPSGSNNAGICPVYFTTTGSLPTGITAGTVYWTIGSTLTSSQFEIATSVANAIAGTAINTSGSQSGTHTASFYASLSSGVTAGCAAINLPAGNWMANGVAYTRPAGTISAFDVALSTSPTSHSNNWQNSLYGISVANSIHLPTPTTPFSFSSTTPIYLTDFANFTSSANAVCVAQAWRMP